MWYQWFKTTGVGDMYMDNYYIKRFASIDPPKSKDMSLILYNKGCITDDGFTGSKSSSLGSSSVASEATEMNNEYFSESDDKHFTCQSLSGIDLLKNISSHTSCGYPKKKHYDIQQALNISKYYLEHMFDFIILEEMHEKTTEIVFKHIFHENLKQINEIDNQSLNNINKTLDYNLIEYMPQEIIDYIIEDNKEDIELYNYAVELFHKRYKIPI